MYLEADDLNMNLLTEALLRNRNVVTDLAGSSYFMDLMGLRLPHQELQKDIPYGVLRSGVYERDSCKEINRQHM